MSRTPFDPPAEDADALEAAARTAERLAADCHDDETGAEQGFGRAAERWTGTRSRVFVRATGAARVRLRIQRDGAAQMSLVLRDFARVVRRLTEEIAACERAYRRELDAQADAETQAARSALPDQVSSIFDPVEHARVAAAQEEARAAARRAAHWVGVAEEAQRDLERHARDFAARMDDIADQALPGAGRLSAGEVVRRVHQQSGIDPGRSSPRRVRGLLDALAVVRGLASTVPSDAVKIDGTVDWRELTERPSVPQTGTDPATVASWWSALSTVQQARLLHGDPARLGNLDGLPALIRDNANRASIPTCRAGLQRAYESGDIGVDELRDKLEALKKVERVIRREDRQLLVLDPYSGRRLHAAVAIGDVDTADHVAVCTTGFGTSVEDSLEGYVKKMKNLGVLARDAYQKLIGTRPHVATVVWMGYDAPQMSEVRNPSRSVATPALARAGGKSLARFLTGINVSRTDDPPHLTALGHSYGSVVTGFALQEAGIRVDDAVLFGSPGPGTRHRSALHVPRGHLFVAEADGDPVADGIYGLAPFGVDPSQLPDVRFLETHDASTPLGHTREISGHTHYLDQDTTSQYNLAAVMVGLDDAAVAGSRPPLFHGRTLSGDGASLLAKGVKDGVGGAGQLAEDAVRGLGRSLSNLGRLPAWTY